MLGPHFCMIGCNGLSFAPLEEPGYSVPLTPLASSLRILLAWSLEALWGEGLFSLVMLLQNILFTSNSSKIHSILPFWHFTTLAAMNPQLLYLLKWRGGNEFIRIKKNIRKNPILLWIILWNNNFLNFSCFFNGDKMSCYSHILSGQSADLHGIQSQIYKVLKVLKVFFFLLKCLTLPILIFFWFSLKIMAC